MLYSIWVSTLNGEYWLMDEHEPTKKIWADSFHSANEKAAELNNRTKHMHFVRHAPFHEPLAIHEV